MAHRQFWPMGEKRSWPGKIAAPAYRDGKERNGRSGDDGGDSERLAAIRAAASAPRLSAHAGNIDAALRRRTGVPARSLPERIFRGRSHRPEWLSLSLFADQHR